MCKLTLLLLPTVIFAADLVILHTNDILGKVTFNTDTIVLLKQSNTWVETLQKHKLKLVFIESPKHCEAMIHKYKRAYRTHGIPITHIY